MPTALDRMDKRRKVSAGFTLVELMAVVAISGILMALLLPALSSAKEKSRRCVCKANIEQVLSAFHFYANDFEDYLPTAADDQGDYHAIILSDFTFTTLSSPEYLGGETNSFYCPNLEYAMGQMGGYRANVGYTIGYGYLATNDLISSSKGPFNWVSPQRTTDTPGAIFADANYWNGGLTIAPHSSAGSVVACVASASQQLTIATNSASAGAVGGNEGFIDGHVDWRSIHSMQTYPASSDGSAYGNW
ncbi:MAG: type II secretion system protein [Verrucomicrobiota bacterium]|jgi:prepilin-type N-terminal cleavage/methylation domain-containing protein